MEKQVLLQHNGKGIFKGIKKVISATRYHSLIIDKKHFSKDLIITAETIDKIIMGIMHKNIMFMEFNFILKVLKLHMGIKILKNFINY